ncbi:YtxH domain-containing protein [Rhabdothermincola salaria]|uniref:YtxH domain-containing protein n=1 Tax=Rhabdothermincola salaria TaxID=2903142 RepID=UPI001E4D60CF|nr:YtxH domain-containing protein [Rhabdothermincola salaria]MCD9622392.1 hypothetical protein [Rhabdothermincola salaria]
MSFKTGFIVGAAVGYYFGAKAGRDRYEQIDRQLEKVRSHPKYQVATEKVGEGLDQVKGLARDKASGAFNGGDEPSWEPGLEFNPDYRPTEEEIREDVFGREPQAGPT